MRRPRQRDRILKKLIPKFGPAHLVKRGDPFVTLARSVVGQQISVPSAQSPVARGDACQLAPAGDPLGAGTESRGLSKRKTEYILDLAQHFVSGALRRQMDVDGRRDVIAELTQIRGISRWTAEMFLIFNLLCRGRTSAARRPEACPRDQRQLLSGEPVTRNEARVTNWEPWRAVAPGTCMRRSDAPDADALSGGGYRVLNINS